MEIGVTSSFRAVTAIHWSVVCSVDKPRVCKPLAKCTPPHMQNTVVYELVMSPDVAQLHNMLEEIILYIGEAGLAPLPQLFPPHKIANRGSL